MAYKEVKNKGTKKITLRDYSEVALFGPWYDYVVSKLPVYMKEVFLDSDYKSKLNPKKS